MARPDMPARDSLRIAANSSTFDIRGIGGPPSRLRRCSHRRRWRRNRPTSNPPDRGGARSQQQIRGQNASPFRGRLSLIFLPGCRRCFPSRQVPSRSSAAMPLASHPSPARSANCQADSLPSPHDYARYQCQASTAFAAGQRRWRCHSATPVGCDRRGARCHLHPALEVTDETTRRCRSEHRPHGVRPLFTLSHLQTPAPLGSRQIPAPCVPRWVRTGGGPSWRASILRHLVVQ